jgi:hypothetical protein
VRLDAVSEVLYYGSTGEGSSIGAPPWVRDEDIQHALRHSLLVEVIDEDPTRYLVLGPDRAGNLLELCSDG